MSHAKSARSVLQLLTVSTFYLSPSLSRFDPDDIRKFKSVPTGNKKFSADYDWNDMDPTVPEGWKSAIITMNSFGKMVESVRFLSPDGRFCTSRVEAIKYLLKDGGANHDDLMRMQMGLLQVNIEHLTNLLSEISISTFNKMELLGWLGD